MFGEIGFEPFGKFTAGKHDMASTTFAFEPNICAETGDSPFVGTAGMLFAQAQVIFELEVGEHGISNAEFRMRKAE
jgi:hypothetical protein